MTTTHNTAPRDDAPASLPRAATPAGCGSSAFYDTAEALTNAVVGLAVSWLATLFVLGFTATQSAWITGMFFALSFSRAWILRRIFRGLS